jgi:excisionase family DNA binding protein
MTRNARIAAALRQLADAVESKADELPPEQDPLMTPNQISDWLGVDPSYVNKLGRIGELRPIKIGRAWRVRRSQVEALIERKTLPAPGGQLRAVGR